jgi:5-(carboxyamino)imidazole ribonucleotide synthase
MKIGILGGGQLGRMLALAGYPLGFRFRILDTSSAAPAGHLAKLIVARSYRDEEALQQFVDDVDVVTYEFENVPVDAARKLAERVPVYPPPAALEAGQDRLTEKELFRELGIPVPPFAAVDSYSDLTRAAACLGLPAVLKTRRMGYDGKGQFVLRDAVDVERAWAEIGRAKSLILESFVPFEREVSIIAVRAREGATAFYPLVQNEHPGGILGLTLAPAPGIAPALQAKAEGYASALLERLDYVGTMALELFQCGDELLANEMAPRVHNSGHWTIEGAETSQFENHLRAVTGLPLGSTAMVGSAAMLNLIGGIPKSAAVLEIPGAHLHLYGKTPVPGRKVGHLTVHRETEAERDATLSVLRPIVAASRRYANDGH